MARLLTVATGLVVASALSSGVFAQDADGDGISDGADLYPCDATASAVAYAPARGMHGLLQFEDQWPLRTDYDFNDVVVAYNYVLKQNAAGQTVSLRATFDVMALGGKFDNGLALHLPVSAGLAGAVTRTVDGGPVETLQLRTGDAEITVELSNNLREFYGHQADQINSLATSPAVSGSVLEVVIQFVSPVVLSAGVAPFDLFVFRSGDETHEIHATKYCGSARMNQSLFGQGIDASTATRCFVDAGGRPFALDMSEQAMYPVEGADVALLYPAILDFAASGGLSSTDFYLFPVTSFGYPNARTPRFVNGPDLAVDLSCNPSTSLGAPTFRQTVDVANPNSATLTNYQVVISVDTANLIASGRLAPDCSNLRIGDSAFKRIPHWITERNTACGSANTRVWANVPSIPPGGTTLYVYYGEVGAADVSDGRATFIFFDDFSGPSLNTNDWATLSGTSFTQSGGVLTENASRTCGSSGEADVYYQHGFAWTDYMFEADVYAQTSWYPGVAIRVQNANPSNTSIWWHEWNTTNTQGTLRPFVNNTDYSWAHTWRGTTPTGMGVWRTAGARVFGNNYQSWLNGVLVNDLRPVASSYRVASGTIGLNQHCGYPSPQVVIFDNPRVARTVDPAPVVGATHSEVPL
jgi:LruC domain-containing protein